MSLIVSERPIRFTKKTYHWLLMFRHTILHILVFVYEARDRQHTTHLVSNNRITTMFLR
jgi:hypothetical protein